MLRRGAARDVGSNDAARPVCFLGKIGRSEELMLGPLKVVIGSCDVLPMMEGDECRWQSIAGLKADDDWAAQYTYCTVQNASRILKFDKFYRRNHTIRCVLAASVRVCSWSMH